MSRPGFTDRTGNTLAPAYYVIVAAIVVARNGMLSHAGDLG